MAVFEFFGQTRDGPGGTNLSAERAGVLAVALLEDQARHEPRGKNARQSGLEDRRLQDVGGANFHALAAADAQAEERLSRRRPGGRSRSGLGGDQSRDGPPRQRPEWRPRPRCPPTRRGGKDRPAAGRALACFRAPNVPNLTMPFGQWSTQSMHRVQAWGESPGRVQGVHAASSAHWPHALQTRTGMRFTSDRRANSPNIAPAGQSQRHQNRRATSSNAKIDTRIAADTPAR